MEGDCTPRALCCLPDDNGAALQGRDSNSRSIVDLDGEPETADAKQHISHNTRLREKNFSAQTVFPYFISRYSRHSHRRVRLFTYRRLAVSRCVIYDIYYDQYGWIRRGASSLNRRKTVYTRFADIEFCYSRVFGHRPDKFHIRRTDSRCGQGATNGAKTE